MADRVAIYCRLSEEDRNKHGNDSRSIENQKRLLRQYADAHGWRVVLELADDDYAGADRNRPGFRKLIEQAQHGAFDIVLCKTQSRFTREIELVEHYLHDCFPRWGIRFVSVVDNADTAIRGNKKSRQINGLVNEWYLEDLSENIRAVLTSRRKSGLHIGSTALYGYQKDPERRGHLLPDPVTAPVVQEIFARYAEGWSQRAIAELLNTCGEPTPAARKGRCNGHPIWRPSTIGTILRNEMYHGVLVQGRYGSESYKTRKNVPRPREQWYRVPNTHTALISDGVWQAVQSRLHMHVQPAKHNPGIFSGKVFCQSCGAPLGITTTRGKRYLQCSTRHGRRADCPGAFIAEQALEDAVLQQLNTILLKYGARLAAEQAHLQEKEKRMQDKTQTMHRRTVMQYQNSLRLLYLDRAAGRIGEADCQTVAEQIGRDLSRLHRQMPEHQIPAEREGTCSHSTSSILTHLTPYMVAMLIDRIAVAPRLLGTRIVDATVTWRF